MQLDPGASQVQWVTRHCILPPAPVANDIGDEDRVPVDVANDNLTEQYAEWSDYGNRQMWVDLALRLQKSERSGRTGGGRRKRRPTG